MMGRDNRSKYNGINEVVWAIAITMAGFILTVFISTVFSLALLGDIDRFQHADKALSVTIIALLIVYFMRKINHLPWSGLRLHIKWTALPESLAGVGLALVITLLAGFASVALGATEWKSLGGDTSIMTSMPSVIFSLILIFLSQGFPEELFFRGHLFEVLSYKVSPTAVLLLTSIAFGSLHFFSESPATGMGERVMFALYAISFGFALAAYRMVKGSLWYPIGFHVGNDAFSEHFVMFGGGASFTVYLIIITMFMMIIGLGLLSTRRLRNNRSD